MTSSNDREKQETAMTTGNGAYATGGMRRDNGRNTAHKLEHIRQSLADIFSTPIGSRIQRREIR